MPKSIQLLIVDDSADDAELLIHHLRRHKYDAAWKRVQTADDLTATLSVQSWDLVLLDYAIPGFGAEAALEIIRNWDRDLPVIIVSGTIGEESAVDLMRAGASDLVMKQKPDRLPVAVQRELDQAKERRLAKKVEIEKKQALWKLGERVKELTTLRQVAAVLRQDGVSTRRLLESIANSLPPGCQFPENTAARATLDDLEAATPNYRETPWKLIAEFTTDNERRGMLEVVYLGDHADEAEVPFLSEEKTLLNSVAEMLKGHLDRLQAQEALKSSEKRYRLLFDSSPHPKWVYEVETLRFLDVNETAVRHYGYTREQFLRMTIRDIRPPKDIPLIEAVVADVKMGGGYSGLWRHRTRAGKIIDVDLTARVVELDGVHACIVLAQDVTGRLEAERERRRTADLLRAVADNTPDALFVKDREGRYLLFNLAAARFVGWSVEEVLGRDDTALFDPESANFLLERDRRVMETGIAETEEERLTAAGVTRTFLATKAPFFDSGGNVVGLIGISRDITEQKQAENALRLSEERFRAFMDNSPALAWITDSEGRFLFASESYARSCGIDVAKLLGRKLSKFFPAEHAEIYLKNIKAVLKSEEVLETVEPGLRADGSIGEFLVYKFPLSDAEETVCVGGVAVDITERRAIEEALQIRDRAIGATTQGIVITNPLERHNPISYVSPGFERMAGYSSKEVLGKNCRFLQGPETDPEARRQLREAVRKETPVTVEILNYRKDGTTFWNELSISPVRDEAGNLTHFVGVQNDITQRKELEEQFRQSQKMEAIGQLAGGIAHDFNNLLTIINGFSEVLLETTPAGDPAREPLEEIHNAGVRSAELTRHLLAFSRRQMVTLEVLELNTIVANSEKMLRRLIGEDIELTTKLAPEPLPIRADAGQIEQVVMNLAVNARDAMPSGGKISIETRSVELDGATARVRPEIEPGRYVMLSVADTGCGISSAIQSKIFDPYFTTKKEGRGTGLGLSVVHGIVKQFGGHLDVSSEMGVGSTFEILLPRVEKIEPETAIHETAEKPKLPRGTETILLIEDESAVRQLTRQVLIRCGYTVLAASGGSEATRIIESAEENDFQTVDLLLTDVAMPEESGPEIAARLVKRYPHLRVLYLSGYTDDTVLRHGLRNTEVNLLKKPFTAAALAAKVRAVLDSP